MMDNEIIATHIRGRSTHVKVEDPLGEETILGTGAEGLVKRVTATVARGGKIKETNLVYKVFKHPQDIKKHIEVYRELKRLGLPVPTTYRETKDGILMTDLSNNGKNLVLSTNDFEIGRLYRLKQETPELFEKFNHLDLTPANQSMQNVIEKASQNGISFDDASTWTFIMKPDSSYSFILNDLIDITLHHLYSPALKKSNQGTLESFIRMLGRCRESKYTSESLLSY